jgi:CheY-like chemotaxis protein/HPt (histidine-containing phosphotransfer) domain-containing protein
MKPQSNSVRVLVVDDDAMSRELLSVLLEVEGYAVESAESGEAALGRLGGGESPPDLVLADVQLPGIAGAELADELRRACGPETLLLAMSGSQPPEEAIAGFDGFLLKPFTMRAVADALVTRAEQATPVAAKEKRWDVVYGPASPSFSKSRLVTIHASTPRRASKRGMETQLQEARPAETVLSGTANGSLVLNEGIYRKLADSMPTKQLLEMYAMCVNDARERIALMRRLAAAHDGPRFVREAHAIKGGCGMLGATELHSMAAALEKSGLEGAGAEGADEVNSLDELAAACDRLERMLGSRA